MPTELSPQEEQTLRRAREAIDDAVRYAGFSERIVVPANKLPLLSWKLVDRLCVMYQRAGWNKVEMLADEGGAEVFALQA